MIHVYGIKTCDSVKKALRFFKEHSIEVEFTDFRANPVDNKKIQQWANNADMKLLFNNKSKTYKDLGLSKLDLDDNAKISWMQKEPLLIKRPVIEYDNKLSIAFNLTTFEEIFLP